MIMALIDNADFALDDGEWILRLMLYKCLYRTLLNILKYVIATF